MSLKPPVDPNSPLGTGRVYWNVVSDGGARAGSTTSQSSAFQAVFNDAAASGGTVFVPDGTYKLNTGLTLADNVHLELAAGAVLDFSGAATSAVFITAQGSQTAADSGYEVLTGNATAGSPTLTVGAASEFTAGDYVKVGSTLAFDPGNTDQPKGEIGIVLSAASTTVTLRSPLADSYATADTGFVAKLTQISNISITGGKIKGGGAGSLHVGLFCDRVKKVRVSGVHFENVEEKSLSFYDCVDVVVDGCRVEGSNYSGTGYGVFFGWACQDCTVSDSFFRDCRHAVTSGGGTSRNGVPRRITYANNHVLDTSGTGDAMDTHGAGENISFIGNTIYDAGNVGINIECPKATAIGNTIVRSTNHGILFGNSSSATSEFICTGNRIVSPGAMGIRVQNSSTVGAGSTIASVVIGNNSVSSSVGRAIYVASTDSWRFTNVAITNNVIDTPGDLTNSIQLQQADNCTVTGNIITHAPGATAAVRLSDVKKSVISGNTIQHAANTSGRAFSITSGVELTIIGNIANTSNSGIVMDSACTDCTVVGNMMRSTTIPYNIGGSRHLVADNGPAAALEVVASATAILLPASGRGFEISGTTNISQITNSTPGRVVTLVFDDVLTVNDGASNLVLNGNYTTSADDTLTLICHGTSWYEVARSAN